MRIDAIIVRDHRETYVATIDDEIVKGKEEKKGKNTNCTHAAICFSSVALLSAFHEYGHR